MNYDRARQPRCEAAGNRPRPTDGKEAQYEYGQEPWHYQSFVSLFLVPSQGGDHCCNTATPGTLITAHHYLAGNTPSLLIEQVTRLLKTELGNSRLAGLNAEQR